jgi:hypothetical protein
MIRRDKQFPLINMGNGFLLPALFFVSNKKGHLWGEISRAQLTCETAPLMDSTHIKHRESNSRKHEDFLRWQRAYDQRSALTAYVRGQGAQMQ